MTQLRSELLLVLNLSPGTPQALGQTPLGERRVAPIIGGRFEGPRLRGSVVETGGADWLLNRPDGTTQLDVRITLKTDDGHLIGMTYRGIRHGDPAALARLSRGEATDPASYYFRVAPVFETGSEKYGWLNRILAVGIGSRDAGGPVYTIFEIL
jgi:hypothetical protein